MARTNTQIRAYIAEIVSIKTQVDDLTARKRIIAEKLGSGTWRSRLLPGIKIIIGTGSGGWRVQWKVVAANLAERLGLSDRELREATYGHRKMTYAYPTCAVAKDLAKRHKPGLKIW